MKWNKASKQQSPSPESTACQSLSYFKAGAKRRHSQNHSRGRRNHTFYSKGREDHKTILTEGKIAQESRPNCQTELPHRKLNQPNARISSCTFQAFRTRESRRTHDGGAREARWVSEWATERTSSRVNREQRKCNTESDSSAVNAHGEWCTYE